MSKSVARLSLTIDVPGLTVEELKRIVEGLDFDLYRESAEIDVKDIFTYLFSGDAPYWHIIVSEKMEDLDEQSSVHS